MERRLLKFRFASYLPITEKKERKWNEPARRALFHVERRYMLRSSAGSISQCQQLNSYALAVFLLPIRYRFNLRDLTLRQNNLRGILGKLQNAGSLYVSGRCADTFSFFGPRPVDIAARIAAREWVPAIPNPSRGGPDPGRVRQSKG